jgi:ATP-dependent helicase STH1/SNF2
LGKTIQTISLITFLVEWKKQPGPFLVIVPLSTITNWTVEFEKWAPSIRTIIFKGQPNQRKALSSQIRQGNFNVVLTTFEYVIRDRPTLAKVKWVYTIIDEGHRMKNAQSKLSVTLCQYYSSRYRLILTGTPLQNNLPELWALLNFILPKIFNSLSSFDDWFSAPFADVSGEEKISLTEEETLLVIKRLHKVLRPFLLRRLKKDVESELPDKVERIIKTKLSPLQKKLYDQVVNHGAILGGMQLTGDKRGGVRGLNNTVMQLRKICNHPYVFEEIEDLVSPVTREVDDNIWRTSGKFELLDRVLSKLIHTGHRVLMFFQMTQVMNIMSDYLNFKNFRHLRLDGSTKAEDRQDYLKLFNAPESPFSVFLLSTRAGGLGLNLQTADTVVIFDSDWNPHQDLQAQDRAHRIGQTKEVRILRLITENSIEERILARAQYKLDMDGKVIQAGKFDNKSTAEERETFLRSLLENDHGSNKDDDGEELTNEELNEILARSEEEMVIFAEMDEEMNAREAQLGAMLGLPGPRSRLMEDDELPEVLRRDLSKVLEEQARLANANDPLVSGISRRANRKEVVYDDGLTEDQFCNAIEKDNYDQVVEQRRVRRSGAGVGSGAGAGKGNPSIPGLDEFEVEEEEEDINSGRLTPTSPSAETPSLIVSASKRKRGRPKRSDLGSSGELSRMSDPASPPPIDTPSTKRIKVSIPLPPSYHSKEFDRVYSIMNEVVDIMMDCTDPDDDDRPRIDLFLELPSRKEYPTYYLEIANPISLAEITFKIKRRSYSALSARKALNQFSDDVQLMFRNARQFNQEGSYVYNDAVVLEDAAMNLLNDLSGSLDADESPVNETSRENLSEFGNFATPRRHTRVASSDSDHYD